MKKYICIIMVLISMSSTGYTNQLIEEYDISKNYDQLLSTIFGKRVRISEDLKLYDLQTINVNTKTNHSANGGFFLFAGYYNESNNTQIRYKGFIKVSENRYKTFYIDPDKVYIEESDSPPALLIRHGLYRASDKGQIYDQYHAIIYDKNIHEISYDKSEYFIIRIPKNSIKYEFNVE